MLNGKCPFELIHNRKPNLSHLRSFGCLCFATVLNNHDKMSFRSEKCILLGYSSVKKAYKLLSLDTRNVFFARDVKFYENIFPLKMKTCESIDAQKANEIEHLNFFDNQWSQSPNDEGRDSPVEDGSEPSSSDVASIHTDTTQLHQEDWGSATHFGDQNWSEGNMFQNENESSQTVNINDNVQTPVLRRSDREFKLPVRFNDYVLSVKVKYGIEKYVNYGRLNVSNKCFASTLNKSNKPTSYEEAVKNPNWLEAMNDEVEALNRNNT